VVTILRKGRERKVIKLLEASRRFSKVDFRLTTTRARLKEKKKKEKEEEKKEEEKKENEEEKEKEKKEEEEKEKEEEEGVGVYCRNLKRSVSTDSLWSAVNCSHLGETLSTRLTFGGGGGC
jgi:uncharacterized membrane protein YdbT with pleckstrin-like domain